MTNSKIALRERALEYAARTGPGGSAQDILKSARAFEKYLGGEDAEPLTATVPAIVARVQAWLRKTDMTGVAVAEASGISEAAIRLAKQDGWNPRTDTLAALAAAMTAATV